MIKKSRIELVGINEQLAQNKLSAPISFQVAGVGEVIRKVMIEQSWVSGADLSLAGSVYFFGAASPDIELGDGLTDVPNTEWQDNYLGSIAFTAGTQVGAKLVKSEPAVTAIYIPKGVRLIYAVLLMTSATQINSAAGDDEQVVLDVFTAIIR